MCELSVSVDKSTWCIWNATETTYNHMNTKGVCSIFQKSFNSYVVRRLIFSMSKVDEKTRKESFVFYQIKAISSMGMGHVN